MVRDPLKAAVTRRRGTSRHQLRGVRAGRGGSLRAPNSIRGAPAPDDGARGVERLPPRILVVEDSATQAAELQAILEAAGFVVTVAPDGCAALARLAVASFDLVLSDVVMPKMGGFALCQAIKSETAMRRTPVILLTMVDDPAHVIAGLEHGADHFMLKPYDAAQLVRRIEELLARRAAAVAGDAEVPERDGARRERMLDYFRAAWNDSVSTRKTQWLGDDAGLFSRLANENAALVETLDSSERGKTEFLSNVSHELRTPIHIILGYTELLLDHACGTVDEHQSAMLAQIRSTAEHLADLVSQGIDLIWFDSGRVTIEPGPVALGEIISRLEKDLRPLRSKPAVCFTWEVTPDNLSVYTDEAKLRTILTALLNNAVKFTEAGRITLRAASSGDGVELSVTDTGVGIAPDALPVIFDRFRQADGSITRASGGLGLGLYFVRQIVELLGGTIAVESRVGHGSTFRLWLPAEPATRCERATDGHR